jgi:hypothetical protein
MTEVGEIITVNGRAERVTERAPIPHHETGEILYYALRAEPIEEEAPVAAGQ